VIKSVEIENFKCYKLCILRNLRRMNVIVGLNGSGKTALMEALFLASGGSPELALRIRAFRGLNLLSPPEDPISLEALWIDLFHQFDKSEKVSIRFVDSSGKARALEINASSPRAFVLPPGEQSAEGATFSTPLNFVYKFGAGRQEIHSMELTPKGVRMGVTKNVYRASMLGPHAHGHRELPQKFSDISKQGEEESIIDAIREDFPQVEDLRVELLKGGISSLWVKVKSVKRRFPIELLSSGISNYLAVLLSIAACKTGAVFVDEIENGLHYSIHEHMWRRVHSFAKKFDTQVFASTHSKECLQAMLPVMAGHESEFSMLRTRSSGEGASNVQQFDGKSLEAAIAEDFEIRS
jgi:hypothetical protein